MTTIQQKVDQIIQSRIPEKFRNLFLEALKEELDQKKPAHQKSLTKFIRWPVGVREFVTSNDYMLPPKEALSIYPEVLRELEEINSGKYTEVVFTGGIGSGKTTAALYTNIYQLYLLSCLRNPHLTLGQDPSSEIMFILQNKTAQLAHDVAYMRMREMIKKAPYFQQHFPFDAHLKSEMVFPNRIIVRPVGGQDTAAIGQNVFGGLIDELNFMDRIEDSRKAHGGEAYDQAIALYNSIASRRESRFMELGEIPGILCLVSSRQYPGQFTDVKEAERARQLKEKGKSNIYVYDKTSWDIKPEGTYSGKKFYVFKGDLSRKPRILEHGETVKRSDLPLILKIPIEERPAFNRDIYSALRDRAGVSTLAKFPYFVNTELVNKAFGKVKSVLASEWVDFVSQYPAVLKSRIVDGDIPRFAHIDLSISGDSAGLAVGHVRKFIEVDRGDLKETLPEIAMDLLLEIRPPKNGEIEFSQIRKLLYNLRELGINIRWTSFDSFQSRDSIQILRTQGFQTGLQSVDKDSVPYDFLKGAFYDSRLLCPTHALAQRELVSLEKDQEDGKVDHPPGGSKDVADALAGVVYGLTTRREIWAMHGIPPVKIPDSVRVREPGA